MTTGEYPLLYVLLLFWPCCYLTIETNFCMFPFLMLAVTEQKAKESRWDVLSPRGRDGALYVRSTS